MVSCEAALELDDGGVGVRQFLPDGQRLLERLQRLCRLPGIYQQNADGFVALGQDSPDRIGRGLRL